MAYQDQSDQTILLGYLGHRGLETVTAFVLINLLSVLMGWVNVQPLIIEF